MIIKSLSVKDAITLADVYVRRGNTVTVKLQAVGLVGEYYRVEVTDGPDADALKPNEKPLEES